MISYIRSHIIGFRCRNLQIHHCSTPQAHEHCRVQTSSDSRSRCTHLAMASTTKNFHVPGSTAMRPIHGLRLSSPIYSAQVWSARIRRTVPRSSVSGGAQGSTTPSRNLDTLRKSLAEQVHKDRLQLWEGDLDARKCVTRVPPLSHAPLLLFIAATFPLRFAECPCGTRRHTHRRCLWEPCP